MKLEISKALRFKCPNEPGSSR